MPSSGRPACRLLCGAKEKRELTRLEAVAAGQDGCRLGFFEIFHFDPSPNSFLWGGFRFRLIETPFDGQRSEIPCLVAERLQPDAARQRRAIRVNPSQQRG